MILKGLFYLIRSCCAAAAILLLSAIPLVSMTMRNDVAEGAGLTAMPASAQAIETEGPLDYLAPAATDIQSMLHAQDEVRPIDPPPPLVPRVIFPEPEEEHAIRAAEPPAWTLVGSSLMLLTASRHRRHKRRRDSMRKLT